MPANAVKKYVVELERAVYHIWKHSQQEYIVNARRLVFNLGKNGVYLVHNHTASALAALNDTELAKGTPVEKRRHDHEHRRREFARLVATELHKPLLFDLGEDAIRCPFCKGKQVITSSIQKRSADEGASNYGECQNIKCGKRFPVNS